jgi:twitching motility protein PilU
MVMQTFDQSLYDLYKSGKITLDEAIKNADSANNLRLRVKLAEEGGFEEKKALAGKKESAATNPDDLKLQVDLT